MTKFFRVFINFHADMAIGLDKKRLWAEHFNSY